MENKTVRILVVDDEEAILLAFGKLLKRPDIEIDTSETLEHAKELIDNHTYTIAIIDLRLSGTLGQEGFEIIAYLKKMSPGTITALITAYGSNWIEQKAASLGADLYFEKPISIEDLNSILESVEEYQKKIGNIKH